MGDDSTGADRGLSDQQAFDLLSSYRRRLVLRCLDDRDGVVSLGELAKAVAALENGVTPEAVTRRQRKRVYTALRQTHLPRMADAGVVEYDPDRGDVAATPAADDLLGYLDDGPTVDWSTLYAAVAGCAAVGLVGSAVGIPLLGALPWMSWALSFGFGVASLAAAQLAARGSGYSLELPELAPSRRGE